MSSIMFRKNILVNCILLSCFGLQNIYAANNENDVYRAPSQGNTSLLMMLDSSNGMDEVGSGSKPQRSIKNDYPNNSCNNGRDVIREVPARTLNSWYNTSSFIYGMPYCLIDGSKPLSKDNVAYSRMDRMKVAMTLLLGSANTSNKIIMGLGQFSTQTKSYYYTNSSNKYDYISFSGLYEAATNNLNPDSVRKEGNDVSAKIVIPAAALDSSQRNKMSSVVAEMGSGGKAPLAGALAEAGAYMLGTSTLDNNGNAPKVSNTSDSSVMPFRYAKEGSQVCLLPNISPWYSYSNGSWISSNRFYSCSQSSFSYYDYSYSGFNDSVTTSKERDNNSQRPNQDRYKTPVQSDTQQCNANGIFLVTNSAPTETPASVSVKLMQNALADPNFTCSSTSSEGIQVVGNGKTDFGWSCMAKFAQELNRRRIKVAIAGYGNSFTPYLTDGMSSIREQADGKQRTVYNCDALQANTNYVYNGQTYRVSQNNLQDVKNACYLGNFLSGYGEGGFYPILSPDNLSDAVQGFISTLDTSIPSTGAATPTVPYDTLNNTQQLSSVYYAQFQPDIREGQKIGIWLGNIKKYWIDGNGIYKDRNNVSLFDLNGKLSSSQDYWNTSGMNDDANTLYGGALSQLPVKQRSIYREDSTGDKVQLLKAVDLQNIVNANNQTSSAKISAKYLLNLMGYSTTIDTSRIDDLNKLAGLKQIGASLHSSPVFFTTEAKLCLTSTDSSACLNPTTQQRNSYYDRKDFILFGTMQGLIQVVNATTGKEVFSFLPQAIIDNQQNGFIAKSLQTGSAYTSLYQGMDAPWSVYTSYSSNTTTQSIKASTLNVYGGMRRGGNNYYGLDLATNNADGFSPKRLFTIAPSGNCSASNPIGCMGQSWSKPAIGWIKWKGKPQLVMIVGGGYDTRFDDPDYKASAVTKGNGVYIFAAKNSDDATVNAGDLLWWTSSSAIDTSETGKPYAKNNTNLKYSVVSEIKTVDRDSDGFIDNLYFGDLGGQIFRIDINNTGSTATNNIVVSNVVRLANFGLSNKVAPKFYNMPTFTINNKGAFSGDSSNANYYGVLSVGSGDISSPSQFAIDGITDKVYGIFDKDIGRSDLYTTTNLQSLITLTDLTSLATPDSQAYSFFNTVKMSSGWYDELTGSSYSSASSDNISSINSRQTRYKVLSGSSALKNTLFMSYYDAADNGSSGACQAGIKGRTYLKTYCLPFGKLNASGSSICSTDGAGSSTGRTYSDGAGLDLGSGVQPLVVNGYQSSGTNSIGPITPNGNTNSAKYSMSLKFVSKNWYEE